MVCHQITCRQVDGNPPRDIAPSRPALMRPLEAPDSEIVPHPPLLAVSLSHEARPYLTELG